MGKSRGLNRKARVHKWERQKQDRALLKKRPDIM
jgi:hypothetical protein